MVDHPGILLSSRLSWSPGTFVHRWEVTLQPLIVLEMGSARGTALTGGRQESEAMSRQVNVEQGGTGGSTAAARRSRETHHWLSLHGRCA